MNLVFYDSFIGNEFCNMDLKFINGDDEHLYNKNLEKQPIDWIYRNSKVVYSHNDLGHRSKHTTNLNFDDYILFTGCSHTYGLGLKLDTTYVYKLAHYLKKDYYNLSLPSTGIDVLTYNLLSWITKFPKPKHIFIQWPEELRFLTQNKETKNLYSSKGVWLDNNDYSRFLVLGDDVSYWQTRAYLSYKLIKQNLDNLNIKSTFISFAYNNKFNIPEYINRVDQVDQARDLIHPGIKTNDDLYNKIIKTIDN